MDEYDTSHIADETLFTPREACQVFFRGAVTPSTLHAERQRNELTMVKFGNKWFVSAGAIRESVRNKSCREEQNPPDFTFTRPKGFGSSVMADISDALVSVKGTADKLKKL